MLRGGGQNNAKNGAYASFGIEFESATVFVNNACGNGQSQTGAIIFGAEKWVKNQGPDFWRDAGPGIGHFEDNGLGGLAVQLTAGLT